jgi:hypothetical protein
VNGIEKDLTGRARVVRLNILSRLGGEVAASCGVRAVPTTIVLDGAGNVTYRQEGLPSRKKVVEAVVAPA